ncbi:MAG: hypothetical protein GY829_14660 [Gammaproteobacteria bacterium]|nr:hypothetical protein [Gammaproteobacteria bacterium]
MNINTCLKLADCAKKDKTLIREHIYNGVDFYIMQHIVETGWILSLHNHADIQESVVLKTLEKEKTQLEEALAVYE